MFVAKLGLDDRRRLVKAVRAAEREALRTVRQMMGGVYIDLREGGWNAGGVSDAVGRAVRGIEGVLKRELGVVLEGAVDEALRLMVRGMVKKLGIETVLALGGDWLYPSVFTGPARTKGLMRFWWRVERDVRGILIDHDEFLRAIRRADSESARIRFRHFRHFLPKPDRARVDSLLRRGGGGIGGREMKWLEGLRMRSVDEALRRAFLRQGEGVVRTLLRTEGMLVYRDTLREIGEGMGVVRGWNVRTSPAHPRVDICDDLEGFVEVGGATPPWHPNCWCTMDPVFAAPTGISRRPYTKRSAERLGKYVTKAELVRGLAKIKGVSRNSLKNLRKDVLLRMLTE